MNQESQPVESSQPKQGPGDKLQTARISSGMTLEEVAAKMHLSTGILTSLEENNFEDITAPIFVKGYLRAYSRLVNINEDEIIQQYATYYMNGDPPISSTSNASPEINSDDSKIKWITYLVILALIALLSTWWWNRYQQAPEMVSLESGNKSQAESLAFGEPVNTSEPVNSDFENTRIDAESSPLQQEIQQVAKTIDLPLEELEQLSVDTAELQDIPVSEESLNNIDSAQVDERNLDNASLLESETENISSEEVQSENPDVQNDKDLVITVNADTWASIRDANGKKLVYDLLKSGEKVTVSGKAPFKAFLGNGYGVTMKYKGQDIDLSQVIRSDNTARISIGQ